MNPELDLPTFDIDVEGGIQMAQETGGGLLSSPWFWSTVVIIIVCLSALIIFKRYIKKMAGLNFSFRNAILLVTLPKESLSEEAKKKSIKELLAPMENFFDNIGGLRAQRGLRANFLGRSDNLVFEIVASKEGVISFYAIVPRYLEQFFEQQVQAQYPSANIEEVEDYNIFLPQGVIKGVSLKLKNYSIFPIKTYIQSETDPLNAITNSLSKIAEGDAAAIQIVARSAKAEWHRLGAKVASKMQQGKNLKQALREVIGGSGLSGAFKGFWEAAFPQPAKQKPTTEIKRQYQLSPMEQGIVKALEEKTNKAGMDVNIRIVVSAKTNEKAKAYLSNIVNAFAQYTGYEYGNGFKAVPISPKRIAREFIYRTFDEKIKFILNTEEMTSIFHLPLPTAETPNIRWLIAKRIPAAVGIPAEGIIIGKNVYRGEEKMIRIKPDDRQRHVYVVGKTGVGKSWLLINMAIQDIKNGKGVCFIDPHGDAIETILEHIPKSRAEEVIYFDPANLERPMGLNLLEYDPKYPEQKTFVINEMINIMDKLYDLRQTGGPMFEQYMRNAMLLIMEHPGSGSTLMEIPKVLADADFRHFKLDHCQNLVVSDFWTKEAEKAGGEAALSNMTPYITSKLNQFVANDIMRPIIGQQKSAFNFRNAMDERKIILINLSKGRIGDMNAYLLGLVLVGKILMAALSRTDIPESERKNFFLYIDEFQNFITQSINTILAEARKYRLCLNMAHQYIGQLVKNQDASIRDAIFGTVGTIISFKVGVEDAEFLSKEFSPVVSQYDLVNVERYNAYIKLLVDNQSLKPFNIQTVVIPEGNPKIAQIIKQLSALKYGRAKVDIENDILKRRSMFSESGEKKKEPPTGFESFA